MFRRLWDILIGRNPAEAGAPPKPADTAEPHLPGYTYVSAPSPDPFSPLYNPQYMRGIDGRDGGEDSSGADPDGGGDGGGD